MDYSKEYDYLVQRFLPGSVIKDMGYDIRKCSDTESEQLMQDEVNIKNGFWGRGESEFKNNLKNIIKMYPLVFYIPKAVERLQKLCMLYDLISVPEDMLKRAQSELPGITRYDSFAEISHYIIFPYEDFFNSGKLSKKLPSDHIIVDDTVVNKVANIWNKNRKNIFTPCDLINTGMLPAPDIEIRLNNEIHRVMIDPTADNSGVEWITDDRRRHLGFIVAHSLKVNKRDITIEISEDVNGYICMERAVFLNSDSKKPESVNYFDLCRLTHNIMNIWYGLQLLMLHPTIKYVFEHPKMQTFYNIYSRKPGRKDRKTYSIKTIKITNTMLDIPNKNVDGNHHVYKCPLWWVIGHKRTKKGKVEWVRGYWKGKLKDLGKPQEYKIRERVFS